MTTTAESTASATTTPSSTVPSVMIGSKPTLLNVQGTAMRFLIMDAPRPSNLHLYIRECRKHHVTDVVRVCESTYSSSGLETAGISVHELPYSDGHSPPQDVLDRWLKLVSERFFRSPSSSSAVASVTTANGTNLASVSALQPCIAVHCVAGLGRAPVLVAIALVEFARMDPVEAVVLIRQHRRGAINDKQLHWLEQYQRTGVHGKSCCSIM